MLSPRCFFHWIFYALTHFEWFYLPTFIVIIISESSTDMTFLTIQFRGIEMMLYLSYIGLKKSLILWVTLAAFYKRFVGKLSRMNKEQEPGSWKEKEALE